MKVSEPNIYPVGDLVGFLRSHPFRAYTRREIADELSLPVQSLHDRAPVLEEQPNIVHWYTTKGRVYQFDAHQSG